MSCAESRNFLNDLGIKGEIIHTPGHSDDSVSIILDSGIAIVGDLYPLYSALAFKSQNINESWNKILKHKINTIYYGHAKEDKIKDIWKIDDVE